ncbi:MAG: tetratricopeptide repeat protein [Rhizobiaceae bacterium]
MADQVKFGGGIGRKTSLFVAGLLAASASLVLLPADNLSKVEAVPQNPVIAKVLTDARKHHSKGRYLKAATLLKEYATSDNPLILLNYAKLLARGWGVPKDLDKARELLLMAVQHDFSERGEAAFELGRVYRQSRGPDCKRIAFEWFVEAAKAGHIKAHAQLGRHYARGIGVAVDMHSALAHYRIAARSGAANSLVSFVQRLDRSNDPDFAEFDLAGLINEAIPALESEAAGGRGSSAKVLGRLYRDGVYVGIDQAMAQMWFERGARLGDSGSMVELAQLLQQTTRDPVNIKRSIALLERAADLRNAGALTELGRLHLTGRFGLDRSAARAFFKKGVEAGHAGSMLELARLHLQGKATRKDQTQAVKLLKRGAAKGHSGCKKLLAKMLKVEIPASAEVLAKIVTIIPVTPTIVPQIDLQPKRINPTGVANPVAPAVSEQQQAPSTRSIEAQLPSSPMTGATVNTRFGKKG